MVEPPVRPRILLITRNLPPLVGGMERLNWHMAKELGRVAQIRVVGPEGAAATAPAGVAIVEAPLRPLWKFLLRARAISRREARTWTPDIVLAGSGLTAPLARSVARLCGAKTAAYVHGLDIAVKHPVYRAIWLPALRRMDQIIANSRATASLCEAVGIDPARIGIVHPGVDLPDESPPESAAAGRPEGPTKAAVAGGPEGPAKAAVVGGPEGPINAAVAGGPKGPTKAAVAGGPEGPTKAAVAGGPEGPTKAAVAGGPEGPTSPAAGVSSAAGAAKARAGATDFRQRHNLGNRPLLLSVGRLSARKGLREFVANALPKIAAIHPDVMLLIVGDAPKDALLATAQTPDSIRAAAAAAGVAKNLRFLGKLSDAELDAAFAAANVHVFPVREIPGDPEGFGMVAVEAAAHGLPTVAFASGGVVDAVAEQESGHVVRSNDYPAFAAAVVGVIEAPLAMRATCLQFAKEFEWSAFGRHLQAEIWPVLK